MRENDCGEMCGLSIQLFSHHAPPKEDMFAKYDLRPVELSSPAYPLLARVGGMDEGLLWRERLINYVT